MAGEAVSGRYGAARHAVADEGGPQRHPASDDRSLVDRLLAGDAEPAFDWGWGDPAAGDLVTDREPLHDIPELWGSDERSGRDSGEPDGSEEKPFPTPRLHGESRLDEGATGDREPDGGPERPADSPPTDLGAGDRVWSDRSLDDLGSDDWSAPAPEFEDRRPVDLGPVDLGPVDLDPGVSPFGDRPRDDQRFDGEGLDGDPLGALSTGRVLAAPSPLGDSARDRGTSERDPLHDVSMDGDHAGARAGSDPLDRDTRDRLDRSPLAPPLPNRDPLGGDRPDLDAPSHDVLGHDVRGREPNGDLDRIRIEEPRRTLLGGDPLNGGSPERGWPDRDQLDPRPRGGAPVGDPAGRGPSDPGPLERPQTDEGQFGGGFPRDLDRFERDPHDRGENDRDQPGPVPVPAERKPAVADPRLRRWADRNRPSGPPRDPVDGPAAPAPFADEHTASDPLGAGPLGADLAGAERGGADRGGAEWSGSDRSSADPLGSDRLGPDQIGGDLFGAGPDGRDRPDVAPEPRDPALRDLAPRDPDPFADPAFTESAHTGRIRIPDAAGPGPERPGKEPFAADSASRDMFDQGSSGRDALDLTPDPTTAFTVVSPAGPARRGAPEEPALPLEEYAARRRAAEQAALSAEEAASSAAERASAAIAAAARAAEEAESAAEVAAKAAENANEAAEAEVRAIADAVARGEAPGQQDGRTDAPEPPTQAVPLIAPAGAPGRRPPPRRPSGPPPRGARPDEPGRPAGPPPRSAHRSGPARDSAGRDGAGRDSAGRDGSDGEATAVLTGLEALRDPARLRGPAPAPEPAPAPAPAEVTSVTRRRPTAEPVPATDDADDVDDAKHLDEQEERGLAGRFTSRPVIAAVGVGAVLVLAAIVAIFTTSGPEAAPAEATPAALSEPVAQQPQPAAPAIDPRSQKAVAFLTALRDADIPTSSSGQAETEAAAAICAQLDQGADEAQLARSVPAVLPDVTRGQASDVVDSAQKNYC
jgi:uncharacterized protein DUF732